MLRSDVPLARHTSWRVGGHARHWFRPQTIADLQCFLSSYSGEVHYLGLGSNTLVRDGGVDGTVVALQGAFKRHLWLEGDCIEVEAGLSCPSLARLTARAGYHGLEFLAGIPGTLGGALRMNAGCHGACLWDTVVSVRTLGRDGVLRERPAHDWQVGYRSVLGLQQGECFVSAVLQLCGGSAQEAQATIQRFLDHRAHTQPIHAYSCGSVFRNPSSGGHAAALIDACGLKGCCIGGAQISPKHANFIVHRGEATANDIEALMQHAQRVVAERFGVWLEPEVCTLGERSDEQAA